MDQQYPALPPGCHYRAAANNTTRGQAGRSKQGLRLARMTLASDTELFAIEPGHRAGAERARTKASGQSHSGSRPGRQRCSSCAGFGSAPLRQRPDSGCHPAQAHPSCPGPGLSGQSARRATGNRRGSQRRSCRLPEPEPVIRRPARQITGAPPTAAEEERMQVSREPRHHPAWYELEPDDLAERRCRVGRFPGWLKHCRGYPVQIVAASSLKAVRSWRRPRTWVAMP
jgi:hypothetical protein